MSSQGAPDTAALPATTINDLGAWLKEYGYALAMVHENDGFSVLLTAHVGGYEAEAHAPSPEHAFCIAGALALDGALQRQQLQRQAARELN